VNSEQLSVNSEEDSGRAGCAHAESNEQTDVSQNELDDLKEVNGQQAAEIERLKGEVEKLQTTAKQSLTVPPEKTHPSSCCSDATRGVKPSRAGGASVLQSAAKKAATSNSRKDVHEYMRLRRNYV